MNQVNEEKQRVGEAAAAYIEDGMMVGLGTGSTVYYTILKLAQRIDEEGMTIQTVSTSNKTTEIAQAHGITVLDFNGVESVDLTIDGCDEFDSHLRGIKGGGGALLCEKIVASASKRNIWVADSSKAVEHLGKFPLPIEVLPFGHTYVFQRLKSKGMEAVIRKNADGTTYHTDSGNLIFDLYMQKIDDPAALSLWLNMIPGVVENGLFIDIVDKVIFIKDNAIQEVQR